MVDLAGLPSFGGGGVNIRQNVEPPVPVVPVVEPGASSQASSGRMSSGHPQTDSGQRDGSEFAYANAKKRIDPNATPGPPPTFQISLLEMDRDLAETLARINATYAMERDAAAIASPSAEAGKVAPAAPDAPREAKDAGAAPEAARDIQQREAQPASAGSIADPTALSAPAVTGEVD